MTTTKKLRPVSLKDISSELELNQNPQLFLQEIDEWVRDAPIIYHKNRMKEHGHIIIITEDDGGFSLYRCFMIGANWECSCDVQEKELWEVFSRVFYLLES